MASQVVLHRFAALLLLLSFLFNSADAYCKQGSEWIEYNGNCYYWSREEVNWFRAELNCKSFGGHLVSIKNRGDNDFLLRLTQCSANFWIGMVNTAPGSAKNQTRDFEWWDGTPHNYSALSLNNIDYRDCVFSSNWIRWYNTFCQHPIGYICMVPSESGQPQQLRQQQKQDDSKGEKHQISADGSERANNDPVWYTSFTDHTTDGWGVDTTEGTTASWPVSTPSPIKCPSGWQLMDNACYFVSANRTNYFNAQMSCQAMGGSVASLLSRREHTLLTIVLGCYSPTWIGLEKARPCFKQPSKDHCWVWMDRSPVVYLDWASGQNTDRRDAECVIVDGQWKVMNCYAEYRYVCKRPAYGAKTSA